MHLTVYRQKCILNEYFKTYTLENLHSREMDPKMRDCKVLL